MALQVYTARVGSYRGDDALDVTRKSGGIAGGPFAPSWELLSPYLEKRQRGGLTDVDWQQYAAGYVAEMRRSYATQRSWWDALLRRARVTLLCYCRDRARCHRGILAGTILRRLGATDCGELAASLQADLFARAP